LLAPALVQWLGGVFMEIPFLPMMLTICKIVILPLFLSMFLRRYIGKHLRIAKQIAPGVEATSIIIICSCAIAANKDTCLLTKIS
jgi:bile acid:Na+ symporter, BASS family